MNSLNKTAPFHVFLEEFLFIPIKHLPSDTMSRRAGSKIPGYMPEDESSEIDLRISRVSNADPLTFFELDKNDVRKSIDPRKEKRRQEVWNLYFNKGLSIKKIMATVKLRPTTLENDLNICKDRYNEWIERNGLYIYGTPAHRLVQHLDELYGMLEQLQIDIEACETERDKTSMRRLELDIMKELAKLKGIEPQKEVSLTLSVAEESRKKMREVFP